MLTRWRHAGDLLECLHQSYSGSLSRISLLAIKAIAVLAAVDPVICNTLRPATQPMSFNIIARSPLCGHCRVASCITVGKSPCVKKPGMSWVLRQKSVAGELFAEERMMNRPVGDTAAGDSGHLAASLGVLQPKRHASVALRPGDSHAIAQRATLLAVVPAPYLLGSENGILVQFTNYRLVLAQSKQLCRWCCL